MRIRWRGLELPSQVIEDAVVSTPTYGRFIIEPFERGFGTTVGNSLRRILLSSLEGAAVTQVKIAGVEHEFTSIEGVLDDTTNILLNIKELVVSQSESGRKTMTLSRDTAGEVRAGDIVADPAVEIINKDHLITTLTADVKFSLEMWSDTGSGYRPVREDHDADRELGVIPLDAVFSPVTRVRYKTEETRVGQRVNYDRLVLEIWTKGTVLPEDALVEAAKILRKHLNPFVQYHEPGDEVSGKAQAAEAPARTEDVDADLLDKMSQSISALDLSVRANNCLVSAKIDTVGALVKMDEAQLLLVRSFGRTSLREVKRKLQDLGLSLGMSAAGGGNGQSS